ncbi:helix-turn-helix domain-containing protein [Streptosporangium sp. NPDC048047]|uniref:winged helix-turn-helix transcriptional regulator n=1 Tax=Streptosporangium sp. NPDC048047 TaxID=3155748 RepID=UPI0034375975
MEGRMQVTEWTPGTMSEVFHSDCPARVVLDHVTSRWGVWVLMALQRGDLRFYELRERIEGISEKMLSQTLRTLVRDGLVWREVEPSTPPKVTYGLTPLGRGTGEPLAELFGWIRDHAFEILDTQAEFDRVGGK